MFALQSSVGIEAEIRENSTVLGANIVNMGLIGTFCGYYLYRFVRFTIGRNSWRGMAIATAVSAWTSVFIGSILCALELSLSGTVPLKVAVSVMAFWHLLIGIGEALITLVVINFIWRTRPDLLYAPPRKGKLSSSH